MRDRNSRSLFSPDHAAGLRLRIVLPFYFVLHHHAGRVAGYAARGPLATPAFSFLLPREQRRSVAHRGLFRLFSYFVVGIFRIRNANLFAANQILDSSRGMIAAIKSVSKLFADYPRHTQVRRISSACLRSTWEGGQAPRSIPPRRKRRDTPETVPVSAPFGLGRAAAFRSWEMHP